MRILDVLHEETILVDLQSKDKKGILEELVEPVSGMTGISHEELVKVLMERERLGSTGIDGGIGIPHGKIKNLESLIMGFGISRQGVNFDSTDGQPTYLFFLLFTPENSTGLHLKLLARISKLLKKDIFRKKLLNSNVKEDVIAVIKEEDDEF